MHVHRTVGGYLPRGSRQECAPCWCRSHILLVHWGAAVVLDDWLPVQHCLEQVVSRGLFGPWHCPPASKQGWRGSGNPQQLPSPWTSLKLWLLHRDPLGAHGCGVHGRSTLHLERPRQSTSTFHCAHYTSRLSCQDAAFSPGTSCCRYIRQSPQAAYSWLAWHHWSVGMSSRPPRELQRYPVVGDHLRWCPSLGYSGPQCMMKRQFQERNNRSLFIKGLDHCLITILIQINNYIEV